MQKKGLRSLPLPLNSFTKSFQAPRQEIGIWHSPRTLASSQGNDTAYPCLTAPCIICQNSYICSFVSYNNSGFPPSLLSRPCLPDGLNRFEPFLHLMNWLYPCLPRGRNERGRVKGKYKEERALELRRLRTTGSSNCFTLQSTNFSFSLATIPQHAGPTTPHLRPLVPGPLSPRLPELLPHCSPDEPGVFTTATLWISFRCRRTEEDSISTWPIPDRG